MELRAGWSLPRRWRLGRAPRSGALEPAHRTSCDPTSPGSYHTIRCEPRRHAGHALPVGGRRVLADLRRRDCEPRRVIGWETSTGETAEILQTERLAYWGLNQPGDERYRQSLGLGTP